MLDKRLEAAKMVQRLQQLAEAGDADLHYRGINDWTPLHLAAVRGLKRIVQVLLAHGPDRKPKMR